MGYNMRMRFSKTGKAKYISHLDLMATMRRALLRAGIELKYSEGFNPHPYMSVALPLPVGCGSLCELMDVELAGASIPCVSPGIITAVLPEGLEVVEAYKPERKFSGIVWLEMHGILYYKNGAPPDAADRLADRFRAESIIISKKTKRGASDIDLASFIRDVEFFENGGLNMKAKVFAQNPTISADNLISALEAGFSAFKPDFALFTRTEIFDGDMRVFR